MRSSPSSLFGRGIWNVWLWIAVGILFVALNFTNTDEPRSPYWFSELILYALMLAGLWANARFDLSRKLPIPRRLAPAAYVFLVWLFGMMFELSLTLTGKGIGGMHPETLPSFILAQGEYIPIALVSYFVIRKTRASFHEVFFFAGGKSLVEGLIFTGMLTSVLLSPNFWLSPILLAYYTLAYSSFIALPLLFVNEKLLWKEPHQEQKHWNVPAPIPARWGVSVAAAIRGSIPFYWLLGFVLALGISIFWGLVYGPFVTWLFHLPPNL